MKKFSFISLIVLILLYSNTSKAEVSVDEIRQILNENPEIVAEALQKYETARRKHEEKELFQTLQKFSQEENTEISDVKTDEESNNYFKNGDFNIPPKVEIIKQYDCPDDYGYRICGIVSSNSDESIYVTVRVTYYDKNDTQVYVGVDHIHITDSFGKAQFKTTPCNEKFDYYKVAVE